MEGRHVVDQNKSGVKEKAIPSSVLFVQWSFRDCRRWASKSLVFIRLGLTLKSSRRGNKTSLVMMKLPETLAHDDIVDPQSMAAANQVMYYS